MQEQLDLAKELIQQSRRLLYTTKEIMAVLDSNERMLNSLLAGLENAVPVDVEYDWSAFPEWANFAATDDDGAVWAYELVPPEPGQDSERWYPDWSGKCSCVVNPIRKGHCPHWRSTLRQRPNVKPEIVKQEIDVWALVPDEAIRIAMDEDKSWWWYSHVPLQREGWWSIGHIEDSDDPQCHEILNCPLTCDDWKTSLMEKAHA